MATQEDTAMSDAPTPQTPTSTDTTPEADADPRDSREGFAAIAAIPAGRRTTGNREIVRIEAELVAEGKDLDNPAVPAASIRAEMVETLETKGLPKAWVVCRGGGE